MNSKLKGVSDNKTTFIIKAVIISFILYILGNGLLCLSFAKAWMFCFYGVFLCFYVGIYIASDHYETELILRLFNISTILWIIFNIHILGWNIGVQHYLMVLLVFYFLLSNMPTKNKVAFVLSLCVLRIILFYMYYRGSGLWTLTKTQNNLLQIFNTVIIFWCITIISVTCSQERNVLEKELVEYNTRLEKQANTDPLTQLGNRRNAMEIMQTLVKNKNMFSLCICDIDFFKKVNDTYGHDFGDEVLKKIAEVFKTVHGKDISARWGGEEFLLLFPGDNGDDAFIKVANIQTKIKQAIIEKEDVKVSVTMTYGLAEYDFINGLESTIKEADNKLYMGKNSGRDKIVF